MTKIMRITFLLLILAAIAIPTQSLAANYGKRLSLSERNRLCQEIKSSYSKSRSSSSETTSLGGGIISDSVLQSIYNTTQKISDSVAIILVLGHALTCNAVHANKNSVKILGVTLFSYPNIPVWLCGAIVYFFGFMLTLSITFYLVDIGFKLGFAVIMLPIGIALWPFPPTKDKLTILVSIILKNAAIFAFLAVSVSYALNMIGEAGGGLESIFQRIDNNETDTITQDFSLASSNYLIVLFTLIYSMKLIGSTVSDYVDKFFPDKAFGGGMSASPIHGSLTQAMDFAKKGVATPVASFAKDVAKTQMGRVTASTGKLLSGGYNQQLKRVAHYVANPGEAVNKGIRALGNTTGKAVGKTGKTLNKAVMGTVGRMILGKNASKALQQKVNEKIDKGVGKINQFADKTATQASQRINKAERKLKQTKLGKGVRAAKLNIKKAGRRIQNAYDKTINAFDKVQQGIDKVKNIINQPAENLKQKMYQKIDKTLGKQVGDSKIVSAGKALTRGISKASIALTSGVVKAPAAIIAGTVKMPVKILKTATKVVYVPNIVKATGNVLMHVGNNMQRNKKSGNKNAPHQETVAEREERERREREEEALRNRTWE